MYSRPQGDVWGSFCLTGCHTLAQVGLELPLGLQSRAKATTPAASVASVEKRLRPRILAHPSVFLGVVVPSGLL